MFGFFKKKSVDSALHEAMLGLQKLLTDDDMQLRVLGPQEYAHFSSLSAIDRHSHTEGDFGRSFKNPVPTNGPIGSISYLSNLCAGTGHRITFHRIKSLNGIDIYEYVSLSGAEWGLLFIDMYHSRKSRLIPPGLNSPKLAQQLIGFNNFWDNFPFGYSDQKQRLPSDLRLLYASIDYFAKELKGREFKRPRAHELLVAAISNA